VLSVDRWPDDVAVPTFGPRMVCTGCGIVGADARPNWTEPRQQEGRRDQLHCRILVRLVRFVAHTRLKGANV
jgi:hypothetical protein